MNKKKFIKVSDRLFAIYYSPRSFVLQFFILFGVVFVINFNEFNNLAEIISVIGTFVIVFLIMMGLIFGFKHIRVTMIHKGIEAYDGIFGFNTNRHQVLLFQEQELELIKFSVPSKTIYSIQKTDIEQIRSTLVDETKYPKYTGLQRVFITVYPKQGRKKSILVVVRKEDLKLLNDTFVRFTKNIKK